MEPTPAQELANKITDVIINPIIALLFGVAVLVFVWGLVQFIWAVQGEGEGRDNGKRHMIYGILGIFIMAAAYTIFRVIQNTVTSFH
jgi:ABC-type thiamin/hydroxymethylpyrimidine transport system permease subunit